MISGIQVSDFVFQKETGKAFSLSGLKKGQVLKAKVLGLLPDGRTQLLVAGQKVAAHTRTALEPGREILLKMTREKDTLTFKMVQPSAVADGAKPVSPLVRLLSQARVFSRLGKTREPVLRDILSQLAVKSGQRDDDLMPRLMENLGLSLEKKMARHLTGDGSSGAGKGLKAMMKQDLKAAVLALSAKAAGEGEEAGAMKAAANALETFQQLNSQTKESGRFILPLPIFAADAPGRGWFDFGQLVIDTGSREKEGTRPEDRVIQLAFLLNMSALGRVRADFSVLKSAITGRFLFESQESCGFVNDLVPELKKRLADIDLKPMTIRCQVAEPKALTQEALVRSVLAQGPDTGLNLVI